MATDPLPDPSPEELLRRLEQHAPRVSRYKLEGEFARGGMGAIIKVWDEDLRRHLAMKIVLGQGEAASAKAGNTPSVESKQLARFLEEAQVTGQLDHPGIVPVHELGLDANGRVFFTMKLVKGRDLKTIFNMVFEEQEGWNETRALSVILRACEAMAYAHAKGVIHRDLKPANVMVGNFGEVYVMDWGLARVLGNKDAHDIRIKPEFTASMSSVKSERRDAREALSDSPIVTMDGDVMGTPAYMSPEQARGEIEKLSPRSDVYALGAMLYHLLAREMPFVPKGARMSAHTVLTRVIEGPPKPLVELAPRAPAELVAIVEKAMARDSSARYADTLALAEDLRAFLEHRVVGAYETGAWAETKKWVQRNRPLAASLAAGILVLAVGLASTAALYSKANANAFTAKANEERASEQAKLAQDNARAAAEQARIATANEARATEQEKLATQRANDVLSLSAIQELKELEDEADQLWPAHPENLQAYEAWLAKAKLLIEGRAKDEGPGKPLHLSLADHEAKLAELRLRAKPLSPEQIEADRKSSPSFAEWEQSSARLLWMRRMLGDEPWPDPAEIEATLATEKLPADANGLNELAWPLVDTDPEKIVYGSEVKALVLARLASAVAKASERPEIADTLAWALFRTGRLDEARVEEQGAVADIEAAKKNEYAGYLAELEHAIAEWNTDEARSKQSDQAAQLAARVAELGRDVFERRTFQFDDAQARWWHALLATLVSKLKSFSAQEAGGLYSSGTSEQHGWGIRKRAEFARTIEERSVSGTDARRRWDDAITAIAKSPKYSRLKLEPQLGLLPIGEDPASHLWEFAHLQTGVPAQRGADGKLVLDEKMGLVFVLIPSGTFWMGAQKTDSSGHNYDPQASDEESPVHEVELSAYFLSKYEMTQGQWLRFVGRNPSEWCPGKKLDDKAFSLLNPVEHVSWMDCMEVLGHLGLVLPTEARWEYGCRAGTTSPWWTGTEKENLRGAANVADSYFKAHGAPSHWPSDEWFDDGWGPHAPAGSFLPNAFGLHDLIGNLWEWCQDGYGPYVADVREGDGARQVIGASHRPFRGGGFDFVSSQARSAFRYLGTPEHRFSNIGVRPARACQLPSSPLHQVGK